MAIQYRAFQTIPEHLTRDRFKTIVRTGDQFQEMMNRLGDQRTQALIVDFETSGVEWFKHARACGLGLGTWDESGQIQAYYVPFRHQTGEQQLDERVISPGLKWLWEHPHTLKIAHNIKFEDHFARREGWKLGGKRYDTMTAAQLYSENDLVALKHRAESDLGIRNSKDWESALDREIVKMAKLNKCGKKEYLKRYGYAQLGVELCGFYGCYDIDYTGQLYAHYERHGISSYYARIWETEMALTEALCDVEEAGLPIDREYLEALRVRLLSVCAALEGQIESMLPPGTMFSLSSDEELRNFLQNVLCVRLTKLTKSEEDFAVDDDVLAEFEPWFPVLKFVREWRTANKIATTYTTSILERLDSNDILHGELDSIGTNTGRFSSRNPNLQNFPSDDDDRAVAFSGKKLEDGGVDPWSIRRAFPVRGRGWCRIFYDYSQVELRVLAFYSRDPVLVKAYLDGEDIHLRTQMEVFGSPDKKWRRLAKILNFGLSYCMSEIGYARNAKIPEHEAKEHMTMFFQRYSGIASFRVWFWEQVRMNRGWFRNIFGRARRVPEINSTEFYRVKRAERQAIGSLIQGTAAELTKEATVRIWRWLKEQGLPAFIVTIIHDDIQADCPVEIRDVVARGMRDRMTSFPELSPIPIEVDGQYTETNWSEKQELVLS